MPIAAVIRPGETEFDVENRVQGTLELPLNERGLRQVRELAERLKELSIGVVYAAPQEPAVTTARVIGEVLDVNVKEIDGLSNVDHGLWQGLCLSEIRRKHPRVFKQWSEAPESVCPPGGETCSEAYERARKALRKPLKRKENFAVVSSEPMATLVECVLRNEPARLPSPVGQDHHSWYEAVEIGKAEAVAAVE